MARLELDGVPATALARRWGVPQCGLFRLVASTLDGIHELAAQHAPPGTVIIAEEQTAGRGQIGRTWHSPPGGVWLGMLLQPAHGELGVMSIRAGLVLADVVDELAGRPVAQLKWPNDVVVMDRKLAGILCEGRWQGDALQWLGLGIGVNVSNPIPAEVADRAIALQEILPAVRRLDLLDRLVPALLRLTAHAARLTESECVAFGMRDWLRGRQLKAPLFGRAAGIRPDGTLLVDTGSGTTYAREGHVELA
ncbi:MAG: biotin--[acetyl-CoA-carboxylase] ligase [Gemmatimonadetes bacterium 13_1_40CM_2_70_7]|nr:MAG: biotin--[acetyl-CoA-carboxylase] ligase [Gemmatimonadetes bacterium 13_1_40CM_2_70_7]OLE60806.1 MAG: biotin--[acetyl-CoA-carboxylase] ligase [Gemmatimonadetes bacterium 13_1_20CM_2_70_10]